MSDLKHVLEILPSWKKTNQKIQDLLDPMVDDNKFHIWEKLEKSHNQLLCMAFYEDTKEFNYLENCMLCSPDWIIKIAEEK